MHHATDTLDPNSWENFRAHVLLAEDDPDLRAALETYLRRAGFQVPVVLISAFATDDWHCRGVRGPEDIVGVWRQWLPDVLVIDAAFAHAHIETVLGSTERTHVVLFNYDGSYQRPQGNLRHLEHADLSVIVEALAAFQQHTTPSQSDDNVPLIGDSPAMAEVYRFIRLAARSSASVLIAGKTGTGKDLVARALHHLSGRGTKPFVAVNCGALPEGLAESELFGHEKGAFTGAVQTHIGRFERAHRGTLFLDEVAELPPHLQVKLLRVLEEHVLERVGGQVSIPVDVRILSATHRELKREVADGKFREDLFYRLKVLTVSVPALRERRSDIPALWDYHVDRVAREEGRPTPHTGDDVRCQLLAHDWPGNVRELVNAARHAVTLCRTKELRPADLPGEMQRVAAHRATPDLVGRRLDDIEELAVAQTYRLTRSVYLTAQMLGVSVRKIQYWLKAHKGSGACDAEPLRKRLLVIEDDMEVRDALAELMRLEGYSVVALADGRALLEYLGEKVLLGEEQRPVDAVITDLRMPGMNGLMILQRLRAMQWDIPIIIATAYGDDETRETARQLGVSAFLDKPVSMETLRKSLAAAV